jgi:ABC-type uncharacterized transport system ATPase subunit
VERVKGVSFQIRAGEILGIAGVAGNGQSELLEVLGGMIPAHRRHRDTANGEEIDLSGKHSGRPDPPRARHRPCARGPAATKA